MRDLLILLTEIATASPDHQAPQADPAPESPSLTPEPSRSVHRSLIHREAEFTANRAVAGGPVEPAQLPARQVDLTRVELENRAFKAKIESLEADIALKERTWKDQDAASQAALELEREVT